MLTAQQLVVDYGGEAILHGIDLSPPRGKICALIGPNGCGKSTLLKTLAGILRPRSGQVQWQGQPLSQIPAQQFARQLALLPQEQHIPEGVTVEEVVSYGRAPYCGFWGKLSEQDKAHVARALTMTETQNFAKRPMSDLSGGQRQRVWLAMALAQDTDYLLLDEPTTYLDLNHQVSLMALLRRLQQQGKTVVSVLHDLDQACRYADWLVVMAEGQVVAQGEPQHVMTSDLLLRVFDLTAQVHQNPISGSPMIIVC